MKQLISPEEWNQSGLLAYRVGALLYSPANNEKITQSVISERFQEPYSLSLCLEDSISDQAVEEAERIVVHTIKTIEKASKSMEFYLPLIFLRVREPQQILRLYTALGRSAQILCGFIIPKYSCNNSKDYLSAIRKVNEIAKQRVYMMPIIESDDVVNLMTRYQTLQKTKQELDEVKEMVLNIRVGANDFCKGFGVRRQLDQTIYDVRCVSNILSDIITFFSKDYVVSGPVWEYFGEENQEWRKGMRKEVRLDRLNGFTGKTVIHPTQISVVNESLMVESNDYQDALKILQMETNEKKYVEKSADGKRMNEFKTHQIWAEKVIRLAQIYGVRERCSKENKKFVLV